MKRRGSRNPERNARILALVADGFSTSAVATQIGGGCTRNAVMGVCHREGVQVGTNTHRGRKWGGEATAVAARVPPKRQPRGKCRYIEGEPKGIDTIYCDKLVIAAGAPYCERHQSICCYRYRPPSEEAKEHMRLAQLRRSHGGAAQGHDEERR